MQERIHTEDLSSLYNDITKERGKPLDSWEIVALLEVYGIRDIDAQEQYGFQDVFDMGTYLEKYIDSKTYHVKTLVSGEEIPPFGIRIWKNYVKGLAFAMPMFVQIFFTLTIGYAIWSGISMDEAKATVIALGTFAALIITGATAQAIGRKGLFYLKQEEYVLAANVTKVLINTGLVLVLIVGIIFTGINVFFEILPSYYFSILILFYFLLSILFLNIAIYYMFEEYSHILYFTVFGVLLVYIFHGILKIGLPNAQFIGLVILNIIISIFSYRKISNLKSNIISEGEGVPRASILFYSLIPFYLYGVLYFIFLLTDRIIAWSANIEAKPYFIWFNVPYEMGLDWALVALIFLMGLTEISIHEFMYRINDLAFSYRYSEYQKFNDEVFAFFKKFNFMFILLSIIIIFVVYFIILIAYRMTHYAFLDIFFLSFTPFVYWIAAISYAFLVNGLMNVLFIFSFSRQYFSVKSILYATITNIIVGMILSRIVGLEYAVFGLLAGSIVFWFFSFKYIIKMFKSLEFYYYSSF